MLMFLYTIVPFEIIFAEDEEDERETKGMAEQLVDVSGVSLLVRPDGAGGGVVTRVLSTDPQDFLDRRWQPGSRIRL